MSTNYRPRKRRYFLANVSWSAALASAVIATVVYASFMMLGSAMGIALIDIEEGVALSSLTWSIAIWHIAFASIAVAFGAYISGRLSHNVSAFAGAMNGMLVWALMSAFGFYIVSQGAVNTGQTAIEAAQSSANYAGRMLSSVGSEIEDEIAQELDMDEFSFSEIKSSINEIEAPELKQALSDELDNLESQVKETAKVMAINPYRADELLKDLEQTVTASFERLSDLMTEDKAENLIAKNSNMTKAEAEKAAAKWQKTLDTAEEKLEDGYINLKGQLAQLKDKSLDVIDEGKDSVAAGFGIITLMLFMGIIISAIAGSLGAKSAREPIK